MRVVINQVNIIPFSKSSWLKSETRVQILVMSWDDFVMSQRRGRLGLGGGIGKDCEKQKLLVGL